MNRLRPMIPYLVVAILAFYVLPLFIIDTGSGMAILLVAIPAIILVSSEFYGMKHSWDWLYPFLVLVVFLPAVFTFFNETAIVYGPAYGILALVGSFLGSLISRRKNQEE